MTTENDFRRTIEAEPTNWQLLLIFSDWPRSRGDSRADGYLVLGRFRKYPYQEEGTWWWLHNGKEILNDCNEFTRNALTMEWWKLCKTHHTLQVECFDHAASVFPQLSQEHREFLLNLEPIE